MPTRFKNDHFSAKTWGIIVTGLIIYSQAMALNVTSGQFIQTIHPQALEDSSSLIVNDFFDENTMLGLLRTNILNDVVMGSPPLSTNTFAYAVHSPEFVTGHADRNPGINSFPSNFSFNPNNFIETAAKGRIGLGGVMRYDLPPLADGTRRFFISGDLTVEYDEARKNNYNFAKDPSKPISPNNFGVSGWFIRNHFDFPMIINDILHPTIFTSSDSFYLSGKLGWSPEMTESFFPEQSLYKVVADFVMCGQDDKAFTSNEVKQLPCIFPNITANGQTGGVDVESLQQINLEVDLGVATEEYYPNADYFAAFVHDGVFYWLNQSFKWTIAASPAYQGSLFDFRSVAIPTPTLPSGSLPSGTSVTVYFGVDATQNGTFDEPYRFSSVTLNIK